MGKNVLISKRLFNALCRYHIHEEHSDEELIKTELEDKMMCHTKRIVYSEHKTGSTEEHRQKAFEVYKELQKR